MSAYLQPQPKLQSKIRWMRDRRQGAVRWMQQGRRTWKEQSLAHLRASRPNSTQRASERRCGRPCFRSRLPTNDAPAAALMRSCHASLLSPSQLA